MNTNYDKLAERAERGELSVKPGTVRRGPKAAEEAQRLLMEATGATSADELTRIALGRPTLGSKGVRHLWCAPVFHRHSRSAWRKLPSASTARNLT